MTTGRFTSFLLALTLATGALADKTTQVTPITAVQGERGPVTNLPMPRYVSLKAKEANVRRGPSLSHRIDWVFQRRDMPLRVVSEYGNWRRVVDREGMGGWVHYSLISGKRTVIIDEDLLVIRSQPNDTATEVAMLELGVIADLGECGTDWCRLRAGGYRGWAPKEALFGVGASEVRD
ncbi:SH3 domain-containing protein [Pseudooctadecabacter sp.]|uniref:SH3 domain-containing protein n=1 Tax=Pseudooctadecabacter sp. TaxID=1966338 RepID=UPI0035C7BDE5